MAPWQDAEVDERKILDYLLSADHPMGADKAAFFAAVGYTRKEWTLLRDDLLRLLRQGAVGAEHATQFGVKYVVDGLVRTPGGRHVELRTVWISDGPGRPLRLVTAYPR